MSKFSLNSLGKALSEKSGLTPVEAELFIRKMFDVCNQGLDQDKLVKIKWLGTFKVQAVKDRESINVNTGERIVIEGRDKLSFTPDNILKEIVNKPFAQFETVVVNDGVDFYAIDKKFDEEENEEAKDEIKEEAKDEIRSIAEETASQAIEETSNTVEEATGVSADLQSDEQASLNQPSSAEPASEVIDFLETKAPSKPSSDVIIIGENQPEDPDLEHEDPTSDSHHLLIPRYMVVAASIVVVALIAGMGWFAFNYGKMAAQRDDLAMQLNKYHHAPAPKPSPAKPSARAQMSQEQLMRQKAIEDSIRMVQASEAVKTAEKSDNAEAAKQASSQSAAEAKTKQAASTSSKYDSDERIRTGAYRITGVADVVTVKAGQSIENISKRYLGPGMECYVEAINGTTTVKEGQKIKIPKLELKKKK